MARSTQDTAFLPRETATDDGRTFTEEQHKLMAAQLVAQETAAKEARIAELEAELEAAKAALVTEKDAKDVAEAAKEAAENALGEFKQEVEQAKLVEGRKESRVAKVREILPHKEDAWFAERAEAWASKSDEDFDSYTAELDEAIKGIEVAKTTTNDKGGKQLSGREVAKDEDKGKVYDQAFDLMDRKG